MGLTIVIQSVATRDCSSLLSQLPDAVVVTDRGHDPIATFIRCLLKSGGPLLYLQDDIELCRDFREKAVDAIAQYPANLISFFTLKRRESITLEPGRNYCMSQCVYFPAGMSGEIMEFWAGGWPRQQEHPTSFDFLISDYLIANKLKYVLWHPSLVQHQVVASAIDPKRSMFRQSPSFEA